MPTSGDRTRIPARNVDGIMAAPAFVSCAVTGDQLHDPGGVRPCATRDGRSIGRAVREDLSAAGAVNQSTVVYQFAYGCGDWPDLAVRARVRLSPRGVQEAQEVDPAWPPVPFLLVAAGCRSQPVRDDARRRATVSRSAA